jgi:putative spermidine/putrescine transport system permease protein
MDRTASLEAGAEAALGRRPHARWLSVPWGEVASFVMFGAFVTYMLVPLFGAFLFSVATVWVDTVLPEGYTWRYWSETVNDPLFVPTFSRSMIASVATIAFSVALMTPTLYVAHIAAPRMRFVLEFLSLMPFALPTVVLALSLIRTYSEPPVVLSGTPTLLVMAYAVVALPFVYRALDNSLRAIDTRTLHEAAATLGASGWQTFRHVIMPNIRPGIIAGSLLVLSVSFGEYTLAAFIVGDAWKTSGIWTVTTWDTRPHITMVLVMFGFILSWTASLLILFLSGRRITTEIGQR